MFQLLLATLVVCAALPTNASTIPPTVDLGYGLWKASINTGVVCPQAKPLWNSERTAFVDAYLKGENLSAFTRTPPPGLNASSFSFHQDPRATEDCLFLDVLVPTKVFNNSSAKAPVMVWIFGGGFYIGSAESQGNPAGLIQASQFNPTTAPGVVYVAMNYRLGALGWLSGPTFQNSNGTANAGLHDQRFALEWIQKNIHLFGGDPNRVTIMGGSAGASSIMHQLTAFGGAQGDAPFQQAIPQSPAFSPSLSNFEHEEIFREVLKQANATSLADLRKVSSATLMAANEAIVYSSPYGSATFGPVVDENVSQTEFEGNAESVFFTSTFVPNLPSLLLAQGLYAKNVKHIFTGHNTNEGVNFADPSVQNTCAFSKYLPAVAFPDASTEILNVTENELYPPIFNDTSLYGYNDTLSRLATLLADHAIVCNPYFLLEAFGPECSHAYLFDVGPSLHGEETPYTFYDGPASDGYIPINSTVALTLQNWILNFVATVNPNWVNVPSMPPYGSNRSMGLLSNSKLGQCVSDPAGLKRCEFWRDVLYY